MPAKRGKFRPDQLRIAGKSADFRDEREPPLRIGDRVHLNSGGPCALVVDLEAASLTLAWKERDRTNEFTVPIACVHRCACASCRASSPSGEAS